MEENNNNIVIYQTDDGMTKIDVKLEDETVWLSQQQMADLYDTTKQNISLHIKNIFDEEELSVDSTVKEFLTVQKEGNRKVERKVKYYNLDMIISLGYRVKSKVATNFRRWATERLKEYMIKGFTMDDERLKGNGGGNYWKELLARIKDIRSSEKVLYRQVLDLYATAVDYDPKDSKSIEFFKIVQNKLHYAAHGHTASEVIYERANSDKPFMGLTTFKGDLPVMSDVVIAKNYLTEEEIKILNNLVSGYFDFAEIQAIRHNPMHMEDYIRQLDTILSSTGEKLLVGAGAISHNKAIEKAKDEYKKYQVKTISPVEKEYLETLKAISNKIDFTVIFSVKKANPNGDPLDGNRPRVDYDGFGEVSDVCIKRKIRNRLQDMNERIFVQSDERKDDGYKSLRERAEGCAELKAIKKDNDKFAEVACKEWIDVRSFGQVFAFKGLDVSVGVRGPVTVQTAVSAAPIDSSTMNITKSVNSETKDKKASDTMGTSC